MNVSQVETMVRGEATEASRSRSLQRPSMALGRYRMVQLVGSGGFGTVWLARDEHLQRDVAVKILPRERVIGGRFEREARAAARLSHPGIVTLYEAAVDDEAAYLVSELIRGATLAELLEAGELSDRQIGAVALALCGALAHAHAQGVVHRDVKPSNVLVPRDPASPEQFAKLTDFGVARVLGGDSLTRTGEVIGTAAYMAPEQAEGRPADASADLYSVALVVYEALTGLNPAATHRGRRLGAHLPPLRRQRRDLPRELGQAIDLALRPRARERGDIEELREAIGLSLEHLADERGKVASAWSRPSDRRLAQPPPVAAWSPAAGDPGGVAEAPRRTAPRWPERGVAGIVAAALSAWLVAHLLPSPPVAPAAVALAAGVAIAALPRVGWLALALTATGAIALQGRPGAAAVVLVAALLAAAALPLDGTAWPLPSVAPALGAVGLAGAWPAMAGRAGTAWRRFALGAAGWAWVAMAGSLSAGDLYLRHPPGISAAGTWMSSLDQTFNHVLAPLASPGVLAAAAIWGLGALVLPWVAGMRSLPVRLVLIAVWALGVAAGTSAVLTEGSLAPAPGAGLMGALASALVAVVPGVLGGRRRRPAPATARRGLP